MGIANKHRFGEIIPMSRADVAAGTMVLAQYDEMPDNEKDKCLKRDYLWKAPNMQKLRKEGANWDLVYWQNEIRKSLGTKPSFMSSKPEMKRNYVAIITSIRDMVMAATIPGAVEIDGVMTPFYKYVMETYTEPYGSRYAIIQDARGTITGTTCFEWTRDKIHKQVVRERFGYTPEEAAQADADDRIFTLIYGGEENSLMAPDKIYATAAWRSEKVQQFMHKVSGCTAYYYPADRTQTLEVAEGDLVVVDALAHAVVAVCHSRDEADQVTTTAKQAIIQLKLAANATAAETKSGRKTKFAPELADVRQEGGMDADSLTATPDSFLSILLFRGGEWGNWLNEEERVENLTMCYNSFFNLAAVIGIEPSKVAFNKQLSIAFGSRGKGAAHAHYEPGNDVINLTKMNGAGCLAHEWGHALDRHIAKCYGIPVDMATEAKFSYPNSEVPGTYIRTKDVLPQAFQELTALIDKSTEFVKGSKKFDEMFSKPHHGYWSSRCEMWARAFDCYVSDKLKANGIIDTYLCRGANSFVYQDEAGTVYRAYPVGEEREKINQAFDHLFATIKNDLF